MILKKIYIVLCLLAANSITICQGFNTSINIPISISVTNSILINRVSGNLNFGDVFSIGTIQNLTKNPGNGVLFEVNGIGSQRITVDYSSEVVLNNNEWVIINGGIPGSLTFLSNVEHTGKSSTYTNPKSLADGSSLKIRNDKGIGRLFIWVGGDLEIQPNQPLGEYKGIFTVNVAYN